ncbi:MAG TPA: type I restriction endonuclease [Gemmataceae bacterium]|nr:type I restriction endonuclease [Gemmataceae bacterium]
MSERSEVQNPMLKYAGEIGWQYVSPADALARRGGDRGLFFVDDLAAQLVRLNPGVLDSDRAAEVIRRLNLLRPTIEGNRDALSWLRGEQSIFVPDENRERNVRLIDFDNPNKNLFHVTDEWMQRGAVYRNRADVVFLINGLPVAVAETKKVAKPDGLEEGIAQIRRNHKETPELFTSSQVFEVTQMVDFFYGVTWNTARKGLFNWKDEEPHNYERKVKGFFDRPRFLRLLREHLIFLNQDDVLIKIILRQHQTRAAEKVVHRARDPIKRRGLVWHTQGSGKTLTMISIASRLLRETRGGDKPTVLMIVDRLELEGQLLQNLAHYGISSPREAYSKRELRDILASDYRGLIVSMIHKFDDIPANLNTRENIIVLVDEAHRTTGGHLGNYLMGALPNATYIGFTGTPIEEFPIRLHAGLGRKAAALAGKW